MPNSGAGWRDLQKEIARGLGFEPLDPPHSGDKDCHAEENLGWWLTLHPRSKLLGWAISRGRAAQVQYVQLAKSSHYTRNGRLTRQNLIVVVGGEMIIAEMLMRRDKYAVASELPASSRFGARSRDRMLGTISHCLTTQESSALV